jgi:peptidoglycan/LPS O-acetylase OafA/YrhL
MSPAIPHAGRYRPDIDGLRAVAILAVLAFHAFPAAVPGGFVGVDVFFVISGYLITGLLLDDLALGRFGLVDFYKRRIRRIFPALLVVLAACLAYGWINLRTEPYAQLGRHVAAGAGFVANLLLWSEAGYFDNASANKPLLHLWSLGIEEQFYLAWPLLLWLLWRLRRIRIAIGLLLCASLALGLWLTRSDPVAAFYSPCSRFWELAAGALLATTLHPTRRYGGAPANLAALATPLSLCGVALIAWAAFGFASGQGFPGWRAAIPVAGSACLIAAGPAAFVNRWLLSPRWMVWIGLISYPLYLWHWPLLVFQNLRLEQPPGWVQRLAAIAVAFALAAATWRFVEKPIRFGPRPGRRALALAGAMLATGIAGAAVARFDGLPFRFRGAEAPYASFAYDYERDARVPACWVSMDSPPDAYAAQCVDPDDGGRKPLVLLWGDSHAARLYPGLRQAAGEGYRIAQFTRSGCAPNFWSFHPRRAGPCTLANVHVMREVQALRPDVVVVFSRWYEWNRTSIGRILPRVVRSLRANGAGQVIVVGPAPEWRRPLPEILFRSARELHRTPPARMKEHLVANRWRIDRDMRAAIERQGQASYVSAMDAFCDVRGCLTRLGDDPATLTTWDYGHLTTPAARRLSTAIIAAAANNDADAPASATPRAAPATMR